MDVVFVAGATGYTGREVVRQLCARDGMRVVAHVRPDSPRLQEWAARFAGYGAEVDTTAWDDAPMKAAMVRLRPTHVFALLGTLRARIADAARQGIDPATVDYEAVDYGLASMLLRACADARPRFVYLSAAGVKEAAGAEYYRVRWRMEQELIGSGLPHTIARPSFITGADRDEPRPFERLGAAAGDAALFVAGTFGFSRFRDRYQSTTNTVLAAALIRMAFDPEAAGKIVESEDLRE